MKKYIIITILATVISVAAQNKKVKYQSKLEMYTKELSLSKHQKVLAEDIFNKRREELSSLKNIRCINRKKYIKELKMVFKKYNKKFKSILNEDQLKKLNELNKGNNK